MDFLDEDGTDQEMLEQIAQLDYSTTLLRDQNDEMRSWLDLADEEIASLRSENTSLKKEIQELEKILNNAQIDEAESANSKHDDPDLESRNENEIQRLEKDCDSLKEENKKLTTEIRKLQQEDDVSASKLKDSLQILESEREAALFGLQLRDEVIQQKQQELKRVDEMVQEYSNIIQELRLKNQQLKDMVEARHDEVSFANLLEAKEESVSPALSFAEELRLLDSSVVPQTHNEAISEICSLDIQEPERANEEAAEETGGTDESEQQAPPTARTSAPSSTGSKCIGLLKTVIVIVLLCPGFLVLLCSLAFVTSAKFNGSTELLSSDAFWSGVRFLLQPYCSVQRGDLTPM